MVTASLGFNQWHQVELQRRGPHGTCLSTVDTSLSHSLPQTEAVVFRGTAAACAEHGLVLDAKGITYRLVEADRAAFLWVFPADAEVAAEELARYTAERTGRPEAPPVFVPFAGGVAGALAYAAVLISVAYC